MIDVIFGALGVAFLVFLWARENALAEEHRRTIAMLDFQIEQARKLRRES